MKLPPEDCHICFKGISDKTLFFGTTRDYVVFDLHPIKELDGHLNLNWEGSSVDWDLPNGDALNKLLQRLHKKRGDIQFKAGALRITRSEIDGLISRVETNALAYELREENGNDCHGHILFSSAMSDRNKTTIRGLLANAESSEHVPNHYVEE